jgi:hypothetical protein
MKHVLELNHSQWMALTALIAQHQQCNERVEEYIDCSTPEETVTRPEELLALVMDSKIE